MLKQKALAATAGAPKIYVEDVFNTYLFTGDGSTETANNGIDLSGEGGLVWFKPRVNVLAVDETHCLFDTNRGNRKFLQTSNTGAEYDPGSNVFTPSSTGFSIAADGAGWGYNINGAPQVAWTFRKAPGFFDVVTGIDSDANGAISFSHNLGSIPGCVILKTTDSGGYNWRVWHRSLTNPATSQLTLNSTAAAGSDGSTWTVDSTSVSITGLPWAGLSYVAYVFAHDAGEFGSSGSESVIKCGSYTGNGSTTGPVIDLGWEPQWLLIKRSVDSGYGWILIDNMRKFSATSGGNASLSPNTLSAETSSTSLDIFPTATGFQLRNTATALNASSKTYVYIAIRRGPMKTPEAGTEVYSAVLRNGTNTIGNVTTPGFAPDAVFSKAWGNTVSWYFADRLRGMFSSQPRWLQTVSTDAELSIATTGFGAIDNTGYSLTADSNFIFNASGYTNYVDNVFSRAPGFMDVVCYTGNNVYQQTQSHNLGVAPELIIVKRRDTTANWAVGCNFTSTQFQYLNLNSGADGGNTNAYTTGGFFGGQPTATTFTLAQNPTTNASGGTYVAYLFASASGISKVGSYTGTGTTLQINCGFTSGARFVLIKRLGTSTDAGAGDWYVWNTARGIVTGNDPYVLMNSTAQEVTSTDYIDPYSQGFEISSTAPAAINANGGSYIYLAIA